MARNPLVSPDVIGVSGGAALAAVAVIVSGVSRDLVGPAAFAGGLIAAIVVYVASWSGGIDRTRLVLVGVGVAVFAYPHQRWFRQWSREDEAAVERALELTGTTDLRHRPVDELSGGQRQRAWIAMALAQETPLLFLDEPTTYLDLAHQVEVLDLLHRLNVEEGRTVVLVIHDLNLACRYADHLVAMSEGRIRVVGRPADVVSAEMVRDIFGVACRVLRDPVTGTPIVVPAGRPDRAAELALETAPLDEPEPEALVVAVSTSPSEREAVDPPARLARTPGSPGGDPPVRLGPVVAPARR